jgi:uncharacterized membrane protein
MMTTYIDSGPTVLAAFAASLVEFVEALTVVLAVGAVRGWRWALNGAAAALALLLVLVLLFGQSLARVPLRYIQVIVGTLLLLFGLRWLRKAILRYVGAIALRDELAAYRRKTESLHAAPVAASMGWDGLAFATAFKIVMLEGIEVVFIVIALGATGQLLGAASLGALAALFVVVCLGIWLHKPLANIPENMLKFAVGVLLTGFGTFWVGEGIGIHWPATDWSLLVLLLIYLLVAQVLVIVGRSKPQLTPSARKAQPSERRTGALLSITQEAWSLFVDDGGLALGVVLWAAAFGFGIRAVAAPGMIYATLLVAGFTGILGYSALRAVTKR